MKKNHIRTICAVVAMAVAGSQLSGCVAGSFGLTKNLGGWNRKFSPIPRVLIYVAFIVVPVYWLTLLFDVLLNNTIEFWTDHALVAQNQIFERDGQKILVQHSLTPLRKTVITVYTPSGAIESVSELRETANGIVEVYVNNEMKTTLRVSDLDRNYAQAPIEPLTIAK